MSLIKGTQEFRTILDFSSGKISKNKIKTALRSAEVLETIPQGGMNYIKFIDNLIDIGMYCIKLDLNSGNYLQCRNKLRQYGSFGITIYERGYRDSIRNINLSSDERFKGQYWTKLNEEQGIRMNNLVDIIMIVKRLNNLKMFL